MSTNQLNVLVSLMIAIAFLRMSESINVQTYGYPNQKPAEVARHYCGKELSDTLDIICDNLHNFMRHNSRDQEMEMTDYPFAPDSSTFLSRARARKMSNGPFVVRRYRRKSRNINEECCINKCTISDMMPVTLYTENL